MHLFSLKHVALQRKDAFVLSQTCRSTDLQGQVITTPDWQLVLHYEQANRDKAAELINECKFGVETPYDLAKALREARMDPEVRRKSFIEKFELQLQDRGRLSLPAVVAGGKSSKKQTQQKPQTQANRGKGGSKGGNGNVLNVKKKAKKGKGSGKGGNKTWHTQKDGKNI